MALPKINPDITPASDDASVAAQRASAEAAVDHAVRRVNQLERGRRIMARRDAVLTELAK